MDMEHPSSNYCVVATQLSVTLYDVPAISSLKSSRPLYLACRAWGRLPLFNRIALRFHSSPGKCSADQMQHHSPCLAGAVVVQKRDLTSITTVDGRIQNLVYDDQHRLSLVTGPLGNSLSFTYDSASRIFQVTDSQGRVWTYTYDSNSNLSQVTNSDQTKKQYFYDDPNWPSALTGYKDERGILVSTWAYDPMTGRVLSNSMIGGVDSVTVSYDDNAGTRTVTDSRSNATNYTTTTQLGMVLPSRIDGPSCGCGGP